MPTRRTFLAAGLAGSAALVAAWWIRGPRPPAPLDGPLAALAALDAEAPAIVGAVAAVILDGALPADGSERASALAEAVNGVASVIAGLAPATQKELGQLFSLLSFAPARMALAGVDAPWSEARREQVAAFLDSWRASRWQLQRSAYGALHQIVYAAWYGNPKSWRAIGYGGPPALAS